MNQTNTYTHIIPISKIKPANFNEIIETKGLITKKNDKYFTLQEPGKSNSFPQSIVCSCNDTTNIKFEHAKVKGKLIFNNLKNNISTPIIYVQNIEYIDEEEAKNQFDERHETYFNEENLHDLKFNSAIEIIEHLNKQALLEGFCLTRKKSIKETSITLRCNQHSEYGKKTNLSTGCKFRLSIGISKKDNLWHITSYDSSHNHLLFPQIYVDKVLETKIIETITHLINASIKASQIIEVVKSQYHITLSIQQMRNISKNLKRKLTISETDELYDYMKSINGEAIIYQTKINGTIRRQAIATFNTEEMKNLKEFGDMIAIDPTFAPMSSDWTIIPLTVIDCERKIKSAGVIFTSHSRAPIFKWLLNLLLLKLPSRDVIKTICSDDDLSLNSAFNIINGEIENEDEEEELEQEQHENVELKERLKNIGRIICFWHKISNFTKFLNGLKIEPQTKDLAIKYLQKIGCCRDINYVEQCIKEIKSIDERIKHYFEQNIEPKLQFMAKSKLMHTFTCGYITSSIAESANNMIKSRLNGSALTLTEMRKCINTIQYQNNVNDFYVKARKKHKIIDPLIYDLMSNYNITMKIAEAIAGSIRKMENLTIMHDDNDNFEVYEKIKDKGGNFDHQESFTIINGICSCNKYYQAGIPCSHQLKAIEFIYGEVRISNDLINPRWFTNKINFPFDFDFHISCHNNITQNKNVDKLIKTSNARYTYIMSQTHVIANIGSKSSSNFKIVTKRLQDLENELTLNENINVVDEVAVKPGRKKLKRKK